MLNDISYRYLFPFEKIPPRSRVLIYGAGVIGQEYLKQIRLTNYCEIVGFADRNFSDYRNTSVPVYAPDSIHKLSFDYAVVALRGSVYFNELKNRLIEEGVREDKIIFVGERLEQGTNSSLMADENGEAFEVAYKASDVSFSFLLIGGMGDIICSKRFVMEMIKYIPSVAVDIYCVKDESTVRWLYSDCKNICSVKLDLGVRFAQEKAKYSVSFLVSDQKFIHVENFDETVVRNYNCDFADKILQLMDFARREAMGVSIPLATSIYRKKYREENCYTGFSCGEIFPINDHKVMIPLEKKFAPLYHAYGFKRYITVNCGNGDCRDGSLVAKSWPVVRFAETMAMFRREYPEIEIVQLGDAFAKKISDADTYVLGKEIGLVAHILQGAIFHLDIEGGLVHLATQLGTKCVVLFGPTSPSYYGYEENVNIQEGGCHGCYGLYSDSNHCAKNLKEPECMYSITPEIVMKKIREVFEN